MSSFDIGVCDSEDSESFIEMASTLGLAGIAVRSLDESFIRRIDNGITILKRFDVSGRGLNSIKKHLAKIRKQSLIVSVPLSTVDVANWAAEDKRVDLLTLEPTREHRLRESTARLAAASGTFLEIRFAQLLSSSGLNRSKIIKTFREAVTTATDAGMAVVLSSGAKYPLEMRSGVAMKHIGILIGLSPKEAEEAVTQRPLEIIERNEKKFSTEFVAEGVEIVQRGGNE